VTERITSLCDAVEQNEKCQARHVGSVPIKDTLEGVTVWEGVVEVFGLIGHPTAKRCYAWKYRDGHETRYITIRHTPPVKSPLDAVRAAIASGAQK
jgi:hypothetical protein